MRLAPGPSCDRTCLASWSWVRPGAPCVCSVDATLFVEGLGQGFSISYIFKPLCLMTRLLYLTSAFLFFQLSLPEGGDIFLPSQASLGL